MAVDIFATFVASRPNIAIGETTLDPRSKGIVIQSISLGVENQVNIGSATGGAGVGKATFNPLLITKVADASSPLFALALFSGTHYDTVTFDFFTSGSGGAQQKPSPIYSIACKMVAVSKIELSTSQSDDVITEEITLQYGAIQIRTKPMNKDGTLGKEVMTQWSKVKNNNTFDV